MWKTPTHESLSILISQGLTDAELANYHGCGIGLIRAFLEEFGIKNNIRRAKPEPIFKGEVGCTIEQHISPHKEWRMRFCLQCEGTFQSEGIHNRICDRCKRYGERNALGKEYEGTGSS